METTNQATTAMPQPPQRYDPLCADWFETAGDIDDFIFYGEDYRGSER